MTNDFETGRSKLEELIQWYSSKQGNRNEATTRLQLIDQIFFECLGWSRDDVVLEEAHGKEYSDYAFSAPRRILIVEAKREGDYFELPAGKINLEYSLTSLLRDYPNLKAAIEQAAGYCQKRGVPFGVVTNGHQVVAFLANRNDGLPPLEGKALVFPSLDFMLANFLLLWQSLSKPGIEQKNLQSKLVGDLQPALPARLSFTLPFYPGFKARNIFQTDLQTLSELVIEDLPSSGELRKRFLEECYSQSGALSQYAVVSKSILQTRYAALFGQETSNAPTTVPAVDKEGISAELLAESLSRRPIILIGDVGVGKTTFIRHLMIVEAAPLFENAITIYVDLGSQATLTSDFRNFILDEIERQLRVNHAVDIKERNFVRYLYRSDLEIFARGIFSDLRDSNPDVYKVKELEVLEEKIKNKEEHLKHVINHVAKARKKQVVMFIDNADQRDERTQQQAFLISQEIAERWHPVTVFVALRPETFHRSLQIGALSGYHPKAFTISPPRIDRVIEKRLRFALKITDGEIPLESVTGIDVRLVNLSKIINVFLRSLDYYDDIAEFIDNIAGGNVRLALDLVKDFFGSGHVDTEKIIRIYDQDGRYIIPLHEFLRAVIYGDAVYYDPEQSPIANLFDISQLDPREHFLLPVLISVLGNLSGSETEQGFVETAVVYQRLQGLGFTPDQIDFAIIRGHRKKLIETAARRIPQRGQEMPSSLRVTTEGLYHISRLCQFFPYIDAVVVDTPILISDFRAAIQDAHDIEMRLDRGKTFCRYLSEQWSLLSGTGAATLFDWDTMSKELDIDLERIRRRYRERRERH